MGVIDEQGRQEPPFDAGETDTLLGFLDYQRATLAWKCAGVDHDGMHATVGVSSMTLGGLLKHMAWVEDHWFSRSLFDRQPGAPWDTVDWSADRDWEWTSAVRDTPEQLREIWREAVTRSRELTASALEDGGLDRVADRKWSNGQPRTCGGSWST